MEVLRGPQGTLFGSGSLAGTVRYITNQPELGATNGVVELGASTVDGGSLGGNAKVAFNVPLGDKAALRVASYYNRLAGYIDAVQPDLSVKEDVTDGFRTGVRAAVKIAPNERLSITPRIVYQKVELAAGTASTPSTFSPIPSPPGAGGDARRRRQFTQLEENSQTISCSAT